MRIIPSTSKENTMQHAMQSFGPEMTKEQLLDYAQKRYGKTLKTDMKKSEIIKTLQDMGAEAVPAAGGDASGRGLSDKIRVIFHNQDGPGGADDIFVSVNGKGYLIKREHEVELPGEVMHIIENAKQNVFERGADSRIRERTVMRYSFSVLGDGNEALYSDNAV
jgi:hypothetical protein